MTQRIFDMDNPQDIKDLFDILPNNIVKIKWLPTDKVGLVDNRGLMSSTELFCIAWRDKRKITRPVDEFKWVGCLCWFWDNNEQPRIAVLKRIGADTPYKYTTTDENSYKNCRPVRHYEVDFAEDCE